MSPVTTFLIKYKFFGSEEEKLEHSKTEDRNAFGYTETLLCCLITFQWTNWSKIVETILMFSGQLLFTMSASNSYFTPVSTKIRKMGK